MWTGCERVPRPSYLVWSTAPSNVFVMNWNPSTRFRVSPMQIHADLDSSITLLHTDRHQYFSLKGAGAEVWRLLQTPISLEEMLSTLQDRFDVEPARCREETVALLQKLTAERLVEVVED